MLRKSFFTKWGSLILTILILVMAMLVGCATDSQSKGSATSGKQEEKKPIRFGSTIPLTGSFAAYSKYFKNGTDLAVEEVNASGGINGRPMEVIYEDHKGEPSTGVSALQKLITKDKVNTVFLSMTGVAMAQIPIGDQNQVVMLTASVTFPKFATSSEWTVQDSISVYGEATRIAEYIRDDAKLKSVALIYENSEIGKVYQDKFKETIGNQVNLTAVEAFDLKATDFRGQITKAISGNPQGIVVHGTGQELQLIFKQIREQGYKGSIFSTSTTETSNTMKIAGDAAEGIIYTFNSLDESKPFVKAFIDKYKAKYGEDPEIFAAQHYEMVLMLADILKQGKESPKDIRDAFLNIKDYKGVTGNISFDKDGLSLKDLQLKVIKDGKFQALKK